MVTAKLNTPLFAMLIGSFRSISKGSGFNREAHSQSLLNILSVKVMLRSLYTFCKTFYSIFEEEKEKMIINVHASTVIFHSGPIWFLTVAVFVLEFLTNNTCGAFFLATRCRHQIWKRIMREIAFSLCEATGQKHYCCPYRWYQTICQNVC